MEQIQMPNPAGQMVSRPGMSSSGNEVQGMTGMNSMVQTGQDAEGMTDFKGLLQGKQLTQEKELAAGLTKEQEQAMTSLMAGLLQGKQLTQEKELAAGLTKEQEQAIALLAAGMQNVMAAASPEMQNAGVQQAEVPGTEVQSMGAVLGIPENAAESIVNLQSMKLVQTGRMTAGETAGEAKTEGQILPAEVNPVKEEGKALHDVKQAAEQTDTGSLEETPDIALENDKDGGEKDGSTAEQESAEIVDIPLRETEMKQQTVTGRTVEQTSAHDVMKAAAPQEIPTALAEKIVEKADAGVREFEIQIEPKHLGKIAVKVEYHEGQAAISIICSESKTLEILKQNVDDIGHIVQKNLQEETIILVDEKKAESFERQENGGNDAGRESEWEREREQRRRRSRNSADRFLQELRLGLTE